jgi:hypothetical protein
MQRFLVLVVLPSLFALRLMAQDNPKVEVFGGYQYLHAGNVDGFGNGANTNGWNTAVTVNFNQHLGVAADFSGAYKTVNISNPLLGTAHVHVYTYTFGPVVSFNSGGKINPFVHALFGGAHLSPTACIIFSGSPDECGFGTYDGFAMMLGGGVDVRAAKAISLRLVQFDWVHLPSDGGSENNNVSFSTGIVFRF